MKKTLFTGCASAIVTPFRGGAVDDAALARLIDYQISGGCRAIVACGTTGESAVLSYAEHKSLIASAVRAVNGRVPLLAGAGSNSTDHALTLVRQAEDAGADGLLLVTPYYNKTTQAGLLAHYEYLADRSSLPILLYNVPSRTGMRIEPQTLARLAQHPSIVGVKEAGTDFEAITLSMALCAEDPACEGFSFYSGNDSLALPFFSLGGAGLVSVAANLIPAAMSALCALCLRGAYNEAAALHYHYLDLMNALFCEVNPIPVKEALGLMGLCGAETRLPLTRIGANNGNMLQAVLLRHGLL